VKKLYVGNLSYQATEEEVKEAFSKHGVVTSVRIIKDRDSGRSRGFCFVEMEDATAAITAMNGFDLKGRQLRVNEAQEQQPRQNFRRDDRRDDRGGNRRDNYNDRR
jgi:RNA recognition motif-containing protein